MLGKELDGWPGERWLDVRRWDVLEPILAARFDVCRQKGFDAVEPDNVDGYANESGFPLTASTNWPSTGGSRTWRTGAASRSG